MLDDDDGTTTTTTTTTPDVPSAALVPLSPFDPAWRPILHVSNQVVLYNPTSHALTIHSSHPHAPARPRRRPRICPYCARPLPPGFARAREDGREFGIDTDINMDMDMVSRAPNYFQLLEVANETASRSGTPPPYRVEAARASSSSSRSLRGWGAGGGLRPGSMAEGYFNAFFKEEARLGMGANGSVYLCQHVLDGNPLGHFAVKKIAVGESSAYLLQILREVRLLETLRHPNVVSYHHAWLESTRFSQFGPTVPTLHVLMQWAEGGSLDDLIDTRLGRPTHLPAFPPSSPSSPSSPTPSSSSPASPDHQSSQGEHHHTTEHRHQHSRSARIRAFRALQRAPPEDKARLREKLGLGAGSPGAGAAGGGGAGAGAGGAGAWKAVHLFSAEEVRGLFSDVVEGLAFLHDKSILHLDLKPGNVLLTWDEGKLIPRAMLSDFGTSRDMIHSTRARSGNTGTLEYTAPESLPSPLTGRLQQVDSKADMWSLGMLLHKLLFFRLPYRWAAQGDRDEAAPGPAPASPESDMDRLEREVLGYKGFKSTPELETTFTARRLPGSYPILLESLLNVAPGARPSCERVLAALHDGKVRRPSPIPHLHRVSAISY
ncbi:hypothetical protein HETIRDRAFT_53797 [Heterobasidion irregulare TC 32-1]|uniref:non-specific serine/threonine protein kinase n=1 Tax=Heterobasidion irregulare (strain TC 32-1) TaxID=747525 RepID=W4JRA3_HETIT|nr:uncharacterized protein HETIRDRAFT_53797 [Heterobasidion irregulare TC 32-1]ETW76102.1 hypothetical protein HETIRDRAFT_53797 [Heterobasidion irregulare TC 32-1]